MNLSAITSTLFPVVLAVCLFGCRPGCTGPSVEESQAILLAFQGSLTVAGTMTTVDRSECIVRSLARASDYEAIERFVTLGTTPAGTSVVVGLGVLAGDDTFLFFQVAASSALTPTLSVLGVTSETGWHRSGPLGATITTGVLIHLSLPGFNQASAGGSFIRLSGTTSGYNVSALVTSSTGSGASLVGQLHLTRLASPATCPL